MPIFEYRCSKCNIKFEVLHKSNQPGEGVICPICNSNESKKLLSVFTASMNGRTRYGSDEVPSCANGPCGCDTGMCNLD